MFNRKLLSVLAYIVAVLLAIKAVLVIVMFVWSYFGTPPVVMFPPEIAEHLRYLLMIQELGTVVFLYLVVATLKVLSTCSCNVNVAEMAKKAIEAPMKTVRRVARSTKRKVSK